ncbi:MAG: hypothetical protein WBQ94_12195 [Terracidiphilus sp.]
MPTIPTKPAPAKLSTTMQARVLAALDPGDTSPECDWVALTHTVISEQIGVNPLTDPVRRSLHGLKEGSKSGKPFPGLVGMGLVIAEDFGSELSGGSTHFRITAKGRLTLAAWLHENGPLSQFVPKKTKQTVI